MTPAPKPKQFGYGTLMQPGLDAVTPQPIPPMLSAGADYSKLSPEKQIRGYYSDILGREADTEGLNFWTNALNSGASTESIRQQFLDSPEHRAFQRMRESQPIARPEVAPDMPMMRPEVAPDMPMMRPEVAPDMPVFRNPMTPPEVAPDMPVFRNPMTPPEVAYPISQPQFNPFSGMPSPETVPMPQMPVFNNPTIMDDFMPRNTTPFPRPIGGIPQMPVLIDPMTPPVYGDQAEIDRKRMLNPVPYDPYNTTRQEDILSTTPRPRVPFSTGLGLLNALFANRRR